MNREKRGVAKDVRKDVVSNSARQASLQLWIAEAQVAQQVGLRGALVAVIQAQEVYQAELHLAQRVHHRIVEVRVALHLAQQLAHRQIAVRVAQRVHHQEAHLPQQGALYLRAEWLIIRLYAIFTDSKKMHRLRC